jgi:cell volume regulation protein A
MDSAIATLALLFSVGLGAQVLADALRLPRALVLLAGGAIVGPSVCGFVRVPLGSSSAELILTLGVSLILFHGGLQLSARVLGEVALSLSLLSIVGVMLTAAICGIVASLVFGLSLAWGLLLGAVLAPTDPAILIPLLDRLQVAPKIAHVVIAESALNDPAGAVLAVAVAATVLEGGGSVPHSALEILAQIGVSTLVGAGCGVALALLLSHSRAGVWREAAPVALVAGVSGAYVSSVSAGGSGYLGAFIVGVIVGNMHELRLGMHAHHDRELRVVAAAAAEATVILIFMTLGANVPWHLIAHDALPELAVVATLLFLARPVVILMCALPDRRADWTWRELVFLMWTRETGVVPAALAALMVGEHVPHAPSIVATVALAIIVTLAVQATTKPLLARRLGLVGETRKTVHELSTVPQPS